MQAYSVSGSSSKSAETRAAIHHNLSPITPLLYCYRRGDVCPSTISIRTGSMSQDTLIPDSIENAEPTAPSSPSSDIPMTRMYPTV